MEESLLKKILSFLSQEKNFVFLDCAKPDKDNLFSYLFLRPEEIISADNFAQVQNCLEKIEERLKNQFWAAGFISYESGFVFEESLPRPKKFPAPLLSFGIYRKPLIYNHRKKNFLPPSVAQKGIVRQIKRIGWQNAPYFIKHAHANVSQRHYLKDISRIKNYIRQGETYQVNHTFKYKFNFSGSPLHWYKELRERQNVAYAGLLHFGQNYILSFSPELFFRKSEEKICMQPMKGTAAKDLDWQKTQERMRALKNDAKNQSENIMIVDMLRNDLGRLASTGSVKVADLFKVEALPTLLQMTSQVRACLKKETRLYQLFASLFPSGSVTGAPKISTMKIIHKLEKEPRGIYTGAIGFLAPKGKAVFNVAIRTVSLKKEYGEMGIGSGVVWDSQGKLEFRECKLKADFLLKNSSDFQLIETMLWQKGDFFLLREHLERLEESAHYFHFPFSRQVVLRELRRYEKKFKKTNLYRLRLLYSRHGQIKLTARKLKEEPGQKLVCFSRRRVDKENIFLYHKTTQRQIYDREHLKVRKQGFYDLIFANGKNEVTETAVHNIFIRKKGVYYTPPLRCGLLAGVYRKYFLKKVGAQERALYKKDLLEAEKIFLTNSVRGLVEVKVIDQSL
jgi:para-aminobenzoate synthetase/4-amino-4-deoxychorismate lyase